MDFEAMVWRVRAEFLEMPGLRLTFAQAMRLWGLDEPDCQRVIDRLIDMCFLQKTSSGEVVRAS
jgi:aspartyl-tRNA synthetase